MASRDFVTEVLRCEPELDRIEAELQDEPATVVRKVAPGRARYHAKAIVGAEPAELPEIEAASRRHIEEFVPASRSAVRRLRRDGQAARVDPAERRALEAVVPLMARPAILVQDGRFFPAPQPWAEDPERHRTEIEARS